MRMMRANLSILFCAASLCFVLGMNAVAAPEPERNVEGILDNSFFIEEAYNQEAGVVQHIFNAVYGWNPLSGPDEHQVDFLFTQEWPVGGQTHQFSYTIPYSFQDTAGQTAYG